MHLIASHIGNQICRYASISRILPFGERRHGMLHCDRVLCGTAGRDEPELPEQSLLLMIPKEIRNLVPVNINPTFLSVPASQLIEVKKSIMSSRVLLVFEIDALR
jgi:hypothetical protein